MDADMWFRALVVYGFCTGILPMIILIAAILIVKGCVNTSRKIASTDYEPISPEEKKEKRMKAFSVIGNRVN